MLLVVFAHVLFQLQQLSPEIDNVVDFIYIFHMPAFVFISGYFGKSERSRSFESIVRLVFLFFIFNSLMGFFYGFKSLLKPVYSYWYLVALVAWRLTAHHIVGFRYILYVLIVIAVFSGFYPSIDNTFASARILGFFPFYIEGYLLPRKNSELLISGGIARRLILGLVLFLLLLGLSAVAIKIFAYDDSALQMGCYTTPGGVFGRVALLMLAFLAIYVLRCLTFDSEIPLLTKWGRNSLWIFVLHRPFTLFISSHIKLLSVPLIMAIALLSSMGLCSVLGCDAVAARLGSFADEGSKIFTGQGTRRFSLAKIVAMGVAFWFVVSVVIESYKGLDTKNCRGESHTLSESSAEDVVYPAMTDLQKASFDNAFRIIFAGDLILLEDQVKRGWCGKGYDFSDVFEYAKPYITSADFAIGVLEGPLAGPEAGFSTSNFDDGRRVQLNFPDEFADAVKEAGFDIVTMANNHLLDKGVPGVLRTLDRLDRIGLAHVGAYRTAEEKAARRVRLVERQGIKMAVLSYTYGSNYVDDNALVDGRFSCLTSVICRERGELFERIKVQVERDFTVAKAMKPDIIIVLPHIGTQFSNVPDENQKVWFEIFKKNGADIILGDHPHVVEPALIEEYDGRTVFAAYCPGNFANIYRGHQGFASMLVDVYVDRQSKKVIGGSIVPLYVHARADGNFRAVPPYAILHDSVLRSQLTTDDEAVAAQANRIVTEVVFGHGMDVTSQTGRYYFDKKGFIRVKTGGLELSNEMRNGKLFKVLESAKTVCFIGDGVTAGTKNGGCGWYEPIEEHLDGKTVRSFAKGGCTVSYMLGHVGEIPQSDLYVIALGANDVRYRDERFCAMTAEGYVDSLDQLRIALTKASPSAKFVFIAPWCSLDGDPLNCIPYAQKVALTSEYANALEKYCNGKSIPFINANGAISSALRIAPTGRCLLDHMHPNAADGVLLYAKAVLSN